MAILSTRNRIRDTQNVSSFLVHWMAVAIEIRMDESERLTEEGRKRVIQLVDGILGGYVRVENQYRT